MTLRREYTVSINTSLSTYCHAFCVQEYYTYVHIYIYIYIFVYTYIPRTILYQLISATGKHNNNTNEHGILK